ncbi:MAG: rhodanese-related sulfurtransferase [Sulfurimonas sp.]|jgi:rhodanese-related sulfurtransferase
MKKIVIFLLIGLSMLYAKGDFVKGDFKVVTFSEVVKLTQDKSVILFDARPAKLFKRGSIMNAMNINMMDKKDFPSKIGLLPTDKNAKILSFCQGPKCKLSWKLAAKLKKVGYTNIVVYSGGFPEWKKKGQPVMGLVRECKKQAVSVKAEQKMDINGITLYSGEEDGMVNQFWTAEKLNANALPAGVVMIDVRDTKSFAEGHYKGAINVPYDVKNTSLDASKLPKAKAMIIYCHTGMMSVGAYQSLQKQKIDVSNIFYLDANIKCEKDMCKAEANEDL